AGGGGAIPRRVGRGVARVLKGQRPLNVVNPEVYSAGAVRRARRRQPMLEEPTSLRIEDPGVRALFTEDARFQSWLDVEAALAQAQAALGIIPEAAAREIARKAHLKYLDLAA